MKKVLFVATVVGHIRAFHLPILKWLQENGWETHVAAKADSALVNNVEYCNVFHNIDFTRKPFTFNNILAYCQLKKVFEQYNFDIIHCHTPVGGAITRLAAKNVRIKGTKVIYTAHGFHFYKGAPFLNWLVYYPIEKFLSRYTDVLITINKEDFARAKTFHAKKVEYIPGVGIDIDKIQAVTVNRTEKREKLGIPEDAFLIISVGELNKNKNHELVIKALSQMKCGKDIFYIIVGDGPLKNHLAELIANLGMNTKMQLLGYRTDVIELLKTSDCFVFPSLREGLPVSLMEAMASGLPVVCSNIRGNTDLVDDGVNGYLFQNSDMKSLLDSLNKAIRTGNKLAENSTEIIGPFSQKTVLAQMVKIYLLEKILL